jgi:hypothetical protein
VQHAMNGTFDRLFVPATHFQRDDIELRQIHPADIDAGMGAARGLKLRGIETLGARLTRPKGKA